MQPNLQPSRPPMGQEFHFPQQPTQKQSEPPIIIPLLLILGLSSIFILCFLHYINKSFVSPLYIIQENLKKIKDGNLNINFEKNEQNKAISETFSTLNEMIEGLKEKEKLQNNFVQSLAHDMRAPIVAQERAIAILQEEFNNHELLEGMMSNNDKYLKMINLILEAYSDKPIKIEKINIELYKITQTVIKELTPIAQSKNIKLINKIPKEFNIRADFISINRIIMNLVSNAIENIGNDKEIEIKAFNKEKNTYITITDNGTGISEEKLKTIFDKYASGNKTGRKVISGLGLHIVKDLVTQNGGTIDVSSKVNEYTKFIIKFPNRG